MKDRKLKTSMQVTGKKPDSTVQNTSTGSGARKMGHGTSSIGAKSVVGGKHPISSSIPRHPQKIRG
jgi:hypothetical protein